MPPPAAADCLIHARSSKYKGGTRIAEDVRDLATHLIRFADPDGYRPAACARCLFAKLHVHCYPERLLLGDGAGTAVVRVAQYICAHPDCGATWRVLPLFLARHLWRTWRTVERTIGPADTPAPIEAPKIPARTERRWRARLASTARVLVVLFCASGGASLAAIGMRVGLMATRAELVDAHTDASRAAPGARLAALAGLVDRLESGLRLM
jgi:hypothetical protein